MQLRLCWKRKSSDSSNRIKVLWEYRGSVARASKSKSGRESSWGTPPLLGLVVIAWWSGGRGDVPMVRVWMRVSDDRRLGNRKHRKPPGGQEGRLWTC